MTKHTHHEQIRRSCRIMPLSSTMQSDIESDGNDDIPASSQLSSDMQTLGNKLILQAAIQCGATEPMIDIQWKADRIVVAVDVSKDENYEEQIPFDDDDDYALDDKLSEDDMIEWEDDENIMYEDDGDGDVSDDREEELFDDEGFNQEDYEEVESSSQINLPRIARTINELLVEDGEDSPKFRIAKLHEIEVTTPPFDNVLRGNLMFESYKGFGVIVEHWQEPKKKKKKKSKSQKEGGAISADDSVEEEAAKPKLTFTEGTLVGRDYDKGVTMINVKGRVVQIKNDKIECVSLPKAKREKGVK